MPPEAPLALDAAAGNGCHACEIGAFFEAALSPIYRRLCRTTRLILRGIEPGEAAGAEGISPGNLFRLFREYVGLTPDDLAEVARQERCGDGRLAPARVLGVSLPYVPPLDFSAALELLEPRRAAGVEHVSGAAYQRTFVECGSSGVLEVRAGEGGALDVLIQADRWTGLVHVVERVRRVFNVDVDAQRAHAWLGDDPIVGRLVQMRPGVRPPGSWSLFEAAVKAALGCGWDVRGQDWLEHLVGSAGESIRGMGGARVRRLFPRPDQIAPLPIDELGLPFVKARTVHHLARVAAAGSPVVAECEPMPRRLAAFVALDGVGPVTAARFAWILGDPDAYPEKAGAPLPGTVSTPSRKRARQVADRWRPYRSFAYAQLALSDSPAASTIDRVAPVHPREGLSA